MTFGRYGIDWERRINIDKMRKDRVERARRIATEHGVDAMIVLDGDNMRYLGHNLGRGIVQGSKGYRYMVFPVKSEPILYEFGKWFRYSHDYADWIDIRPAASILPEGPEEARVRQYSKAAADIKKDLQESGNIKGNILIDVYNPGLVNSLTKEGINLKLGASEVLSEARMIKTQEEVESIRMASSIAEGGYETLSRSIKPGLAENELKAIFVGEMYRLGMEYVPSGDVTSGPQTFASHNITSDRLLRHGDLAVAQACGSSYNGYKVCLYRTFAAGSASNAAKDSYSTALDILNDAMKVIKPGATTKDIAEKWPKAKEFGYKDEDEAIWVQWSHGIGLSIPEEPTASRLWSFEFPQKIEEGMTLAIETWIPTTEKSETYPRGQSVRIEQMVHVTETGYDLISDFPIDELQVCK
jgi:Xaa-Pro aminopeptidase